MHPGSADDGGLDSDMAATIEVVTVIAAPCAVVFDLELDVDVHAASLPGRERGTTGGGRRTLQLGDEVTFRARHFGLPWQMSSRVTAFARPHRFVDEQTRGPFRTLHHEHLFEAIGADSTRMIDRLRITAPAGMLGEAVNRMLLTPYLRHLLQQRALHIKTIAERTAQHD